MTTDRPHVAILGGGTAGLTTAWRLTDPEVRSQVGTVTVYQRGFRLGGKGASSRGVNDRIEEHGLHIWLGYYDNAFRIIRECYAEIDRPTTDPESPIRTWQDAFAPAPNVGLEDLHDGRWATWTAQFSMNDELPGEPIGQVAPVTVVDLFRRSLGLISDFYRSLDWGDKVTPESILIATGLSAGMGIATAAESELQRMAPWLPSLDPFLTLVDQIRKTLLPRVSDHDPSRRLWHLFDVVTAQIRGIIRDDLMSKGFGSIDHLDYRHWIRAHGASAESIDSALVRGLYNLAFSHRGGDPNDIQFPAGLGLFLSMKTFFDYKGSIFWKMQAGMGDVVMAPLYEALRARGVRFEFFHRVEDLHLSADRAGVSAITLGRQVRLAEGHREYSPLVSYGGLPCFPAEVDLDQIDADESLHDHDLESFWCQWPDAERVRLERGRDFDQVVLAIPIGMIPHIADELIAANDDWRTMVDTMETVGTQAFQLWLAPDEERLGWSEPGATVTNYVDSYDTFASMSHLLTLERWPDEDRPHSLAYFCSSMPAESDDRTDPDQPRRALDQARNEALTYLEESIGHYFPAAVGPDGQFRWSLLCGSDATDVGAFDSQFVTANVDPSNRYVQALPGAAEVRLRPGDSRFEGLHLAGDWTDCGLNAGCVEATVLSGIGAANSVLGLPRGERITGGYLL